MTLEWPGEDKSIEHVFSDQAVILDAMAIMIAYSKQQRNGAKDEMQYNLKMVRNLIGVFFDIDQEILIE